MSTFLRKNHKKAATKKGFHKNPLFLFGFSSLVLLGILFFGSDGLAELTTMQNSNAAFFNASAYEDSGVVADSSFFSQHKATNIETPDLKLIQDGAIYAIATPRVLSTETLGSLLGGGGEEIVESRKNVIDYVVQPGDTVQSLAQAFNVSVNTVLWANDLSKGSSLKVGQTLVILPVSGVIYVAKSGDTISDIAKKYRAKTEDVITFNNLSSEGDIFIGDALIVPGGVIPPRVVPIPTQSTSSQVVLPNSFFIFPVEGTISQGLHYYNGVDIANKCGTPVYAAAAGVVQRAVANGGWNLGMGNHITVLHANGISTYYGHLMHSFVTSGQQVNVGDKIGLVGRTGKTTGCHLHFQVMGARNPLAGYARGALIKY